MLVLIAASCAACKGISAKEQPWGRPGWSSHRRPATHIPKPMGTLHNA